MLRVVVMATEALTHLAKQVHRAYSVQEGAKTQSRSTLPSGLTGGIGDDFGAKASVDGGCHGHGASLTIHH